MSPLPKRQDYKFTKNLEYAEKEISELSTVWTKYASE